ncbi:MAG: serine/threonine-protein kinase [Pyrinomonadaceae bacterium]
MPRDGRQKQPTGYVADSADGARFASGTMLTERYRIVSLVGRGGMGEVYRAEDLKLKQIVALKFLPETIALDGGALARFHNEVRITRQISHSNVCRVYDIGEAQGRHFLSMEFIDGEDLSSLLRRIGRLPGDKAIEIARQVCAGLAAAHDNGVLHRDLKPANVMIDGRGKARITDFGVAVVAAELSGHEAVAGTPGYMAPEQLTGRDVTERSDIYALGLLLYELFTGKRVFETKNLNDLIRLQQQSTPTSPSSHIQDIDPLVERVILRCLDKDPDKRPASAIQVAAALPGGDPLAAALAAGETPSPEMVAASGEKTALRPAVAVALLAAIVIALVGTSLLGNKVDWRAQVLQQNSPDTLVVKAHDMIQRLGYTDQPTDSAFGLTYDSEYRRYVEQNDKFTNRWLQFIKLQPAPIYFWYRQSPRSLEVKGFASRGAVSEEDPPHDVSGMVHVTLDPLGRLTSFTAVPPQIDQGGDKSPPPEWTALFASAGLDPSRFTPAEPKWTPLAAFDARAAWTGAYPEQPDVPLRIEAAGYRGKPVYFQIIAPWTRPERLEAYQTTTGKRIQQAILLSLIFSLLFVAVLLARYNFQRGRGDRRGAFRLALFVFTISLLSWAFGASHVPTGAEVASFLILGISPALLTAGILWLLYLALEPYVRRRWPDTLVSWNRLLSGSLRDPLVSRDVLVGILFGTSLTLLSPLENLVHSWRGVVPNGADQLEVWLGVRYLVAHGFLMHLYQGITLALSYFFLLFLLRAVSRRQWLAALIFVLIFTAAFTAGSPDPMITAPFAVLVNALTVIALLRFGLVTLTTSFFVLQLLSSIPLTTKLSAWYGGNEIIALLAVLALATFAFHTSLGGQKLFEGKLLDE